MKYLKSLTAILLALALVLSFAACGKKGDKEEDTTAAVSGDTLVEGLSKEEYDSMTADDLLARIADINNVTADEYAWLISTYAYTDIVDEEDDAYYMGLADCITDEALDAIEYEAKPALSDYIDKLLESKVPQVRGYGVSQFSSLFGVSDSNISRAKELLSTEEDNYVLYCATKALSNEMKTDTDIAAFIFKMADADYFKLRVQAANAIGNSWSKGVDGTVDKIIEMMNDENQDVRSAACRYAGKLADDKIVDPLVTILNNDDDADLHGDCITSLVTMWYDYPFHENTSEKAYKATMDYFRRTPRSEEVPSWTAVGSFKPKATTDDSYDKWKAKATYFDTDEVYEVMVDILKDENANWLGRTSAIEVIKSHCSKEQFDSLKSIVDGLTDSDADLIKSSYETAAAEE